MSSSGDISTVEPQEISAPVNQFNDYSSASIASVASAEEIQFVEQHEHERIEVVVEELIGEDGDADHEGPSNAVPENSGHEAYIGVVGPDEIDYDVGVGLSFEIDVVPLSVPVVPDGESEVVVDYIVASSELINSIAESEEAVNYIAESEEVVDNIEEPEEVVDSNVESEEDVDNIEEPEENDDSVSETYEESEFAPFLAIKTNNMDLLRELISSGDDFSKVMDTYGYNALHYAAEKMNIEAIRLLAQSGLFDIDGKTSGEHGLNALHIVAGVAGLQPELYVEAAAVLRDFGADVDATDNYGMTPIFFAVSNSNFELVDYFTTVCKANTKLIDPEDKSTILHFAMESCSRPIIRNLIAYDPGLVDCVNIYNREPIHEAATKNCVDGLKELILTQKITKIRHSPSNRSRLCRASDRSLCLFWAPPLHFAAKFNQFEAVEFLLLIQSDSNQETDEKGKRAQYYAGSEGMPLYDYFTGRDEWERVNRCDELAATRMRSLELGTLEYQIEKTAEYRRQYLHQNSLTLTE